MIIPLLFQTPQPLPPSVSQISVTPENFLEEAPANIFGCPRTKKKVKPRTENVMMSDQSVQKTLFHSPLTPRCVILVQLENLIFVLYWSEEQIQCLRWWTCLILFFYVWFCSFGLLPITPSADQPRVGLPFFTPSPPVNCQADLQAPKKVIFKFNFYIFIKIYEKIWWNSENLFLWFLQPVTRRNQNALPIKPPVFNVNNGTNNTREPTSASNNASREPAVG